ncbi:MAG: hypothetical protein ACKOW3_04135 [Hyphomicrobium sp.]
MAKTKIPERKASTPLCDWNYVQETFSNTLISVQIRDDIAHLTFGVLRPRHDLSGKPMGDENIVSSRQVMPVSVLAALTEAFVNLRTSMQKQTPDKRR